MDSLMLANRGRSAPRVARRVLVASVSSLLLAGLLLTADKRAGDLRATAFWTGGETNPPLADWTDANNWGSGTIASGTGATADFSQLMLTANDTVHLNASEKHRQRHLRRSGKHL